MHTALALAIWIGAVAPGLQEAPEETTTAAKSWLEPGTLKVHVALVAVDLSLKPVPKSRFRLLPEQPGAAGSEITTGFDGTVETQLPAGRYRIRSTEAVELEGRRYVWDLPFEIRPGGATSLELSNDNASVEKVGPEPRGTTAEGQVYQRVKAAVFKVISDGARGSGFLVSADGLILTNHHVVADAEYLAAKFEDGRKHELRLLAEDPRSDIAVLQVHPDTVRGLPVIELADDGPGKPAVAVGQRVLAIGSPLTTETILTSGLVSKVEDEAIYSDVDINPGNSGGPLLDLDGRAVGITTFGVGGDAGPGVAGIVRIHIAAPLVTQARNAAAGSDPPAPRPLPVAASYRFSPEEVKQIVLRHDPKLADYHVEAGKFDLHLITPVAAASEIMRREREAAKAHEKRMRKKNKKKRQQGEEPQKYEPGRAFYEWQKNSDNFRPTVHIRAFPEIKIKTGSAFVAAMVGVGAKYRFKADFDRMELWRGDELIEPIHPGRVKQVVHVGGAAASMKDVGFFGIYEYPPEAFREGAAIQLRVWQEGEPEPIVLNLEAALHRALLRDLEPYFRQAQPLAEP